SEVGVLSGSLRALRESGRQGQGWDVGRVLSEHGVSPEICDSTSERAAPWEARGSSGAGTEAALRPVAGFSAGGGMGSGGVSLVGAAEGLAAELDALDPPAVQAECGDGEAVAGHQCTADGPAVAGEEEPVQTAPVRTHSTGQVVEAP